MTSIEKLGWIGLILTLLVAVAAVIIQPIYDKAVETQQEIENIEFEDPSTSSLNINYAMDNSLDEIEIRGNIKQIISA